MHLYYLFSLVGGDFFLGERKWAGRVFGAEKKIIIQGPQFKLSRSKLYASGVGYFCFGGCGVLGERKKKRPEWGGPAASTCTLQQLSSQIRRRQKVEGDGIWAAGSAGIGIEYGGGAAVVARRWR